MAGDVVDWVAQKIREKYDDLEVLDREPTGNLIVKGRKHDKFAVAILRVEDTIRIQHVAPLFERENRPQIVINARTKVLWEGEAIDFIHAAPASFGTLGDISRAAETGNVVSYRDKDMGFFIRGMRHHHNVSSVSYVFDRVFEVKRKVGRRLIVAVVDDYHLSAEGVRNARDRLGIFDIVVKSTSHGSISPQAVQAAKSMNVEALHYRELLGRLAK